MAEVMEALGLLGGAAAVVGALSAWIGKLWADRILSREGREHQNRLKELESSLRHQVDAQLAQVNFELGTLKEKTLKAHADKLVCYGFAIDGVAKLLAEFSAFVNDVPGQDRLMKRSWTLTPQESAPMGTWRWLLPSLS